MSARVERVLPFLAAAIASVVAGVIVFWVIDVKPGLSGLPTAGMTFGVVVAGFAATQRNMLLGMGQSRVLRHAARTGYYKDILSYLTNCVYAGLTATGVSVAGFFLGKDVVAWSAWLVALVFIIALIIGLVVRNEIMSTRLVSHFMREQAEQ